MKILLISDEVLPQQAGGIAAYISIIAPALAARGHDVHVLSCHPGHEPSDERIGSVSWHRRRTPFTRLQSTLRWGHQSMLRASSMIAHWRELRSISEHVDVIEAPEWMASGLLISLTKRIPMVVQLHTPLCLISTYNNVPFRADRRFADSLERAAAQRACVVTSASRLLADELRGSGWLRRSPEIIRCPVEPRPLDDTSAAGETPRRILHVGRLETRKCPEVLVEAAAILSSKIPDLEIVFAGRSSGSKHGAPYGDWIKSLAEDRGVRVRMVHELARNVVHDLYAACRVVAVPSRFESFSIAAIEAMASARPVVCTSRVGAAELIEGSGGGTVTPPEDPDSFAAALRPYLLDPHLATTTGEAAREIALRHCHPSTIAAQREACYLQAIDLRRASE